MTHLIALLALVVAQDQFHKQAPGDTVPPDEAAKRMTVPEGFTVTAFAAEPAVRQPNAMAIDDRGRDASARRGYRCER